MLLIYWLTDIYWGGYLILFSTVSMINNPIIMTIFRCFIKLKIDDD